MHQSADPTGTHASLPWHIISLTGKCTPRHPPLYSQTGGSPTSSPCFHLCHLWYAFVPHQVTSLYLQSIQHIEPNKLSLLHMFGLGWPGSNVGSVRVVLPSMDVAAGYLHATPQEGHCCNITSAEDDMDDTVCPADPKLAVHIHSIQYHAVLTSS